MEIKRKGLTLRVNRDYSYYDNPRDNDTLGHLVCFHTRYTLGDKHDFESFMDFKYYLEDNKKNILCILPVYMYDHTGITISTTPFADKWDSGLLGYIYCTKQDVFNYGLTENSNLEKVLKEEIKQYDEFIQGTKEYYYFSILDEELKPIDSCSGFCAKNTKELFNDMKDYVDEKYHFLFNSLLKKESQNCL